MFDIKRDLYKCMYQNRASDTQKIFSYS